MRIFVFLSLKNIIVVIYCKCRLRGYHGALLRNLIFPIRSQLTQLSNTNPLLATSSRDRKKIHKHPYFLALLELSLENYILLQDPCPITTSSFCYVYLIRNALCKFRKKLNSHALLFLHLSTL